MDNNETKLKIREPIGQRHADLRTIRKGLVCEHNTRNNILKMVNQLRKLNTNTASYAYKYDQSVGKAANIDLCTIVKLYLLAFEEESRSPSNGMKLGIRWLYLFHDILPNIMIK